MILLIDLDRLYNYTFFLAEFYYKVLNLEKKNQNELFGIDFRDAVELSTDVKQLEKCD